MRRSYCALFALASVLACGGKAQDKQTTPSKVIVVEKAAKAEVELPPSPPPIPTTKYSVRDNRIHDELLELIRNKRESWEWEPKTKEEIGAYSRKLEESEAEANREIAAKYKLTEKELEDIFLKITTERVAIQVAKNKARNSK